jgi:hypothetical protein
VAFYRQSEDLGFIIFQRVAATRREPAIRDFFDLDYEARLKPVLRARYDDDLDQDRTFHKCLDISPDWIYTHTDIAKWVRFCPVNCSSLIDDTGAVGHFWQPNGKIEQMAIEPLPGLDDFMRDWQHLLRDLIGEEWKNEWVTEIDRWRREATQRLGREAGSEHLRPR